MAMRVVILREGLAMEACLASYLFSIYFIIYNGIYNEVEEKNLERCGRCGSILKLEKKTITHTYIFNLLTFDLLQRLTLSWKAFKYGV